MAPRTRGSAGAVQSIVPTSTQQSIQAYSRPIKARLPNFERPSEPRSSKKRKADECSEEYEPCAKRTKAASSLPTPEQTPRKAARPTVGSPSVPSIQSIPSRKYTGPSPPAEAEITALPSPASTPSRHELRHNIQSPGQLPELLEELTQLHRAYLRALSLHYAHNHGLSPVDTRVLIPSIARCWGKRRPTLKEIQRVMALTSTAMLRSARTPDQELIKLELVDYGQSKICIDRLLAAEARHSHISQFPSEQLQTSFEENLGLAWSIWPDKEDTRLFIDSLPVQSITVSPSIKKSAPMLAKGQRRLTDFRTRLEKGMKQQDSVESVGATIEKPTLDRSKSLLQRIKLKAITNNAQPATVTAAQADRRMALNRLDEIIATLDMLSTSKPLSISSSSSTTMTKLVGSKISAPARGKTSFSLAQLVQTIQQSLKNPISKQEIEACFRLLAQEVAPKWVEMYSIGKITGVVLNVENRETLEGWKGRVGDGAGM